MKPLPPDAEPFLHTLTWDRLGRKGQRCEIIGTRNTIGNVQIRFEDGFTAIVNRKALRRKSGSSTLAQNMQHNASPQGE
jgi:uncharacterized protein YgiM (DUF1202 family)